MRTQKPGFVSVFVLLTLLSQVVACKGLFNTQLFKERAAEAPAPDDQSIDKSFFVNADGSPKTFLCAWAPEMSRGDLGERWFTILVNDTPHCNIEFEIKEDALIGKRVQPSFPNDRNRWEEFVRIPITKHYYYEREKDQHGRETNKWVENDGRSHWSARPKMKLNLQSVAFPSIQKNRDDSNAYEIEWDHERGFLGFSVDLKYTALWFDWQFKARVNFLAFKHDPTFKKTPYHQENSRFMNILHVMGRKIEGIEPELYAAHWDLRKTNILYLNNVPKEHEKTVLAAIEKWNNTFREIGAVGPNDKAFEGKVANLKHPFDLRYPTFNWVADNRLSMYSPLGIGMAHADVRNGKILWGSVNLYGGMLEAYITRYSPVSYGQVDAKGTAERQADGLNPIRYFSKLFRNAIPAIDGLGQLNTSARGSLASNFFNNYGSHVGEELRQMAAAMADARAQKQVEQLKEHLKNLNEADPVYGKAFGRIIADLTVTAQNQNNKVGNYFKANPMIGHFGSSMLNKVVEDEALDKQAKNSESMPADMKKALTERNGSKRRQLIREMMHRDSSFIVEEGFNIANMQAGWMNSPARKTRALPELLESVVMDVSLHELGHIFGLGHQFKENIVPEKGTVPSRYIKALAEKATPENHFTNYSTVMGYRHGRTEMITTADDMKPGPHDELVLRYLYKAEYAAMDQDKDDFVFGPVPASGKIPPVSQIDGHAKTFKAAYFPSCNDYEASFAADPFCDRWDRGSTAQDIVKSRFEDINDNLITSLYSLVGGGSDSEYAEARMWGMSLDTMSRVRLFYDEMRRRLRSEEDLKPLWEQLRQDRKALLKFEQACASGTNGKANKNGEDYPKVLKDLFKHKDIVDLCRANLIALNEFRFYLNLPNSDFSRIDHKNKYIAGGYLEGDSERNAGHMFGSWYQLSNLPLKIIALYTLTTARPIQYLEPWVLPNWYYDNEENRFLYRTLYPREYTKIIADGVQHNMRFEATGQFDTTGIGRTILAAGSMLPWMKDNSNDSARLPEAYNELLEQQTKFDMSMVAVIIKPLANDNNNGKAYHFKKFSANIYDFFTDKSTAARDIYILPDGKILVTANGMFIYPITDIKFYAGNESYVIAYKVSYGYKPGDELYEASVKAGLREKHDYIVDRCTKGFTGQGLSSFFDNNVEEFDGFFIPDKIAEDAGDEKIRLFYDSVDKAFEKYEAKVKAKNPIPAGFPIREMTQVCQKSMRGVGQITSSAALINGFWLGITSEYLEK